MFVQVIQLNFQFMLNSLILARYSVFCSRVLELKLKFSNRASRFPSWSYQSTIKLYPTFQVLTCNPGWWLRTYCLWIDDNYIYQPEYQLSQQFSSFVPHLFNWMSALSLTATPGNASLARGANWSLSWYTILHQNLISLFVLWESLNPSYSKIKLQLYWFSIVYLDK